MPSSSLVLIASVALFSFAQLSWAASTTGPLFDLSRQASATSLPASDDGSSEAINLPTPLAFYRSPRTTIFVSLTDGRIIIPRRYIIASLDADEH